MPLKPHHKRPLLISSLVSLSIIPLALLSSCASMGGSASASKTAPQLRNPIAPIADPFITLHQNTYYLLGTHTGTSLELWHETRLERIGMSKPLTIWTPGAGEPGQMVWSPTMFLLDYQGTPHWFIYFTATSDGKNESHRIYVLQSQSTDPLGPYIFKGQLQGMDQTTAIDPSILQINGKLYIMYVLEKGTNAIYIAPLSDPLTQSAEPRLLVDPVEPWERGADSGQSVYPVAEGPTALYHDDKTFVVYSGSDTGNFNYCLGLLTYNGSGDPLQSSSWNKRGPVFKYSEKNGVYGPGRATFTTSPDGKESWMLYHAKDVADFTYEGRVTRAQPFTWKTDGAPEFGEPVSTKTPLPPPSGEM
ncbi:family 43 glycosylhydrolase [Ktedonospora formicarum]|uniref:Glycosyl hydrolase family 43 n=1 Tax=Ktedonospora formicarum TaxID=2778364 RepID=A0A8J3MTD1_9CHLR|nr:glycoside hydrolase family 43 protein [Ktedonospora formicarum]GHO45791.1 glycosyl hydrolase family 43 [Ktedonospora formicarum]